MCMYVMYTCIKKTIHVMRTHDSNRPCRKTSTPSGHANRTRCVCVYVCICVCVYTHAHTHTHQKVCNDAMSMMYMQFVCLGLLAYEFAVCT
jgi:hypothetical protein